MAVTCPSCGTPTAPGAKFCAECGTPLGALPRPAAAPLARQSNRMARLLAGVGEIQREVRIAAGKHRGCAAGGDV